MLAHKEKGFLAFLAIVLLFLFSMEFFHEEKSTSYYGRWEFDHIAFRMKISSEDKNAWQSYGNTILICNRKIFKHRNVEVENPEYVEKLYTKESFHKSQRVRRSDLGEGNGKIVLVKVTKEKKEIGQFFYDEDRDEILGWTEGVFIGAKRLD